LEFEYSLVFGFWRLDASVMNGLAAKLMERINALGQISEEQGRLTRTFASPAMRRANELAASWMQEAGMAVRTDAAGNLIGHYPSSKPDGKILLLGSHLDTVRDAGKFDGPLGVSAAIACVEHLYQNKTRLPFAIEVVAFSDEEGVRYQTAYLGSRALAGMFDMEDLKRTDAKGISMADAIREFGGNPDAITGAKADASRLLGYAEVHIEQGPVLEKKNLSVGVVTAIAGQTRARVTFVGKAGHAGTVPMKMRQDALCAAAEFVLAVESLAQNRGGLVATVGELTARPGASNVIPGEAWLSVDVRHPEDAVRRSACNELQQRTEEIAAERGVQSRWEIVHETNAVICDRKLTTWMHQAARRHQSDVPLLHSGAGHDATALSVITPVTMLFVRCKNGISHHPSESAAEEDIQVAVSVMNQFIQEIAKTL
jgi:allantoate deiminase